METKKQTVIDTSYDNAKPIDGDILATKIKARSPKYPYRVFIFDNDGFWLAKTVKATCGNAALYAVLAYYGYTGKYKELAHKPVVEALSDKAAEYLTAKGGLH